MTYDKDKEYWHIPKRTDLHQSIIFTMGVAEKYHKKTWNASAQDRLGSYLAKKGATNNGRNITPQSIRTLLAAIPQYFGFVYINSSTTPNTIEITEAGKKLIEENKDFINKNRFSNLIIGKQKKLTINISNTFLNQFKKLQITNPFVKQFCDNIYIFPLYCSLYLIKKLGHLTNEEIAIYLFRTKSNDELDFKKKEIEIFRNLEIGQKNILVKEFKKTDIGNKSLVQAPLVGYFLSICKMTNLFKVDDNKLSLKKEMLETANNIISELKNYSCFDFKDNKKLWVDYFGNVNIHNPPKLFELVNSYKSEVYFEYLRNDVVEECGTIDLNSSIKFPILETNYQSLLIFSCTTFEPIYNSKINFETPYLDLKSSNYNNQKKLTTEEICSKIINHINSKNFDEEYKRKLKFLEHRLDKSFLDNKNLRGARLEELFYLLLVNLKDKNILVDDPIWNGHYNKYGLPISAPGGKEGKGDIVFFFNNLQIVLELTTMKAKTSQEKSEAFSVPDHIKNHSKDHQNKKTIGIYLAPIIHKRIQNYMDVKKDNYSLSSLTISDFLESVINFKNIKDLENFLNKI